MRLALILAAVLGFCGVAAADEVTVYMYSEYIDPEITKAFEKQTGHKVKIETYESAEEALEKLEGGEDAKYDVVVASDHAVRELINKKKLRKLDMAKVPNAKHLDKKFRALPYDPGDHFSLAYQWGTAGIMYRKDQVKDFEPTWGLIFDEKKQQAPFVLIDSMRDLMGLALKFNGKHVNARKRDDVQAAAKLVQAAKKSPHCKGFESGTGGKDKVAKGEVAIAVAYNGDAVRAMGEDANLGFVVPKEGGIMWVDAMVIPQKAAHPDAAHLFMNFILDPKVGAQLSNFNRYATPNHDSLPLITPEDRSNTAIYPDEATMKTLQVIEDLGSDTKHYDEAWKAIKGS